MKLKENSKSFTYLMIVYTFSFLSTIYTIIYGISSIIGVSSALAIWYDLRVLISTIPNVIFYSLVLKTYLKDRNNVDKVLSAFQLNIILSLIWSIVSSVVPLVVFKERTTIINILYSVFNSIVPILTLISLNEIRTHRNTTFYKIMLIVQVIYSFVAKWWYWLTLIKNTTMYSNMKLSNFFQVEEGVFTKSLLSDLFGFLILILTTLLIYKYVKDIIFDETIPSRQYLKEENIAKNVILTIITFGIYFYIWLYRISRNIKTLNNDYSSSSGEMICLLFVPLYMLYWVYTRTKTLKAQADEKQIVLSDNATLYLILSLLGFNIISIALLQNDINAVVNKLGYKINA